MTTFQDMLNEIWAYVVACWRDGEDEQGSYYRQQRGFGSQVYDKQYYPALIDLRDDGLRVSDDPALEGLERLYVDGYVAFAMGAVPRDEDEMQAWRELRERVNELLSDPVENRFPSERGLASIGLKLLGHHNTYNDTDSPINMSIDYLEVEDAEGEKYLLASEHQGLDVRSEYSQWAFVPHARRDYEFPYVWVRVSESESGKDAPLDPADVAIASRDGWLKKLLIDGKEYAVYTGIDR